MDELCHFAAYAAHFLNVDVEPCENPAMFTTIMASPSPDVESVDILVCYAHDLVLCTAPGWQRSLRIRHTTSTAGGDE